MIDIFNDPVNFEKDSERHMALGSLDVWIKWKAGEWEVAHRHDIAQEERALVWDEAERPGDVVPERWITGNESPELLIRPLMPERPVVVRPESPVRLLPGLSTDFYVGIPLWFSLRIGDAKRENTLCEIPAVRLSNSWFGTPVEGELCYAMRTRAYREPDALSSRMHRCICPLQVRNVSDTVLSFERVCIRCQHLHIYAGADRLWSNTIRMSYRGEDVWNRVVYAGSAPDVSGTTHIVSEPRKPISRGFLQKSLWAPEG